MTDPEESVEQQIVDAFVALLTEVPGMVTVCDGRGTAFNETELPAANIFTPTVESDSAGSYHMDHQLKVNIVLYLAERTAQRAIRSFRARVYAAIGKAEAEYTGPFAVPGVIDVNDPAAAQKCIQQGDFIGSAQIALNVHYRTPRWGM